MLHSRIIWKGPALPVNTIIKRRSISTCSLLSNPTLAVAMTYYGQWVTGLCRPRFSGQELKANIQWTL